MDDKTILNRPPEGPSEFGEVASTNGNYNDDFFFSTRVKRGADGVHSDGRQPDIRGDLICGEMLPGDRHDKPVRA